MNTVQFYLIVITVYLLSCISTPPDTRYYACHQTKHFAIYYYESEFSLQEVQRIGEKKERLLGYINEALSLDYDGLVSAYLYLIGDEYAYANTEEEIYESRNYVMTDPGHEIVHIVTFEELGYSLSGFLKEGIAVSYELDFENYNAIENYVNYRTHIDSVDISTSEWYETYMPLSKQLANDDFDYSYYSYQRAGAFTKYLVITFGVDKVKNFYVSSIDNATAMRPIDFENIFGKTIEDAEDDFLAVYFSQ